MRERVYAYAMMTQQEKPAKSESQNFLENHPLMRRFNEMEAAAHHTQPAQMPTLPKRRRGRPPKEIALPENERPVVSLFPEIPKPSKRSFSRDELEALEREIRESNSMHPYMIPFLHRDLFNAASLAMMAYNGRLDEKLMFQISQLGRFYKHLISQERRAHS